VGSGRRIQRTCPTLESSSFPFVTFKECQIRHHVVSDEVLLTWMEPGQFVNRPPRSGVDVYLVRDGAFTLGGLERHYLVMMRMAIHDEICPALRT
jgi:hypothetical protein